MPGTVREDLPSLYYLGHDVIQSPSTVNADTCNLEQVGVRMLTGGLQPSGLQSKTRASLSLICIFVFSIVIAVVCVRFCTDVCCCLFACYL